MALRIGSEHGDQQYRTSNSIHVTIDPFGPEKFAFKCLRLHEQIGGELPYGNLRLAAIELPLEDKTVEKTNFLKITIEQDDPVDKYEIYGFIVRRDWSPENGIFNITFACVPNVGDGKNGKFFSLTKRKLYRKKKIKKVIEDTWEDLGDPRFRWKTDADPEPEDWWQDRWSDQDFLQRLCMSVQKKTLFCFDFEGLMVKDIYWKDRITGKPEPDRIATGYESHQPIQDSIDSNYNFRLYRKIENACTDGEYKYGREISKNFELEVHNDTYRIYHKDINTRENIYKYNARLLETNLYNGVVLRYTDNLPPLRLMDTIKYGKGSEENEPTISTYMVTSMDFFISGDMAHQDEMGSMCSFTAVLRGTVDVLGQELPDDDSQDPGQK